MKVTDDIPIGTRFIIEVVPEPKTEKCCECCFKDVRDCSDLICCGIDRQDGKEVVFKLVNKKEE